MITRTPIILALLPGAIRNSVLVDLRRRKASSLTGSRSLTTERAWLVIPFTKPAIFDVVVLSRLLLVTVPCVQKLIGTASSSFWTKHLPIDDNDTGDAFVVLQPLQRLLKLSNILMVFIHIGSNPLPLKGALKYCKICDSVPRLNKVLILLQRFQNR